MMHVLKELSETSVVLTLDDKTQVCGFIDNHDSTFVKLEHYSSTELYGHALRQAAESENDERDAFYCFNLGHPTHTTYYNVTTIRKIEPFRSSSLYFSEREEYGDAPEKVLKLGV